MISSLVAVRLMLSPVVGGALVGVVPWGWVLGVCAAGVGSSGGGGLEGVGMGIAGCLEPAGARTGAGARCCAGCAKGESLGGGLK